VRLSLIDNGGRVLRNLLNEEKEPGEHYITADVTDLIPGIYLYQIISGLLNETKKLIVTR